MHRMIDFIHTGHSMSTQTTQRITPLSQRGLSGRILTHKALNEHTNHPEDHITFTERNLRQDSNTQGTQ